MNTGKTTKTAAASAADYLRNERDIAAYLETMLADGDARAVPVALRTAAVDSMAALAKRTGLSRETLYRTLSENGNPRLDTLTSILDCFGLSLAVAPIRSKRAGKPQKRAGA